MGKVDYPRLRVSSRGVRKREHIRRYDKISRRKRAHARGRGTRLHLSADGKELYAFSDKKAVNFIDNLNI